MAYNWDHIVFNDAFERADKKSELTGREIYLLTNLNFLHILPKDEYPKFCYYAKNIIILTREETWLFKYGNDKQRKKYAKDNQCTWEWIYERQKQLIQEYKQL